MTAAVWTETLKAVGSVMIRATTALLVLGILALSGAMSVAADQGNPQVAAQLGPLAEETGWPLLVGVVSMISASACLLGFGAALSWMVGREFADGTISGLYGLPVPRRAIGAAKVVVFWAWAAGVALAVTGGCAGLGLALGYGAPSGSDLHALVRLLCVVGLTGLIATPTAWVATLGRSLLPGIALSVALIAVAQIVVLAGSGAWFPVAAPALWSTSPDEVRAIQLALVPAVAAAFCLLTTRTWSRLQLDR